MKNLLDKIKTVYHQRLQPLVGAIRQKFNTVSIPSWLFVMFMALYCECLVHIWVMDSFLLGRFAAVVLFALGLGCVLGTVPSFFHWKSLDKWLAVLLGFALVVLYLVEYFVSDSYQVFMTLESILSGAGGVAQDYMGLVLSLVMFVICAGFGKLELSDMVWRAAACLLVELAAAILLILTVNITAAFRFDRKGNRRRRNRK